MEYLYKTPCHPNRKLNNLTIFDRVLIENEKVSVVNLNNGERLETYVIKAPKGSKIIGLNGPAARKGSIGDALFILSYASINPKEETIKPIIVDCRD